MRPAVARPSIAKVVVMRVGMVFLGLVATLALLEETQSLEAKLIAERTRLSEGNITFFAELKEFETRGCFAPLAVKNEAEWSMCTGTSIR